MRHIILPTNNRFIVFFFLHILADFVLNKSANKKKTGMEWSTYQPTYYLILYLRIKMHMHEAMTSQLKSKCPHIKCLIFLLQMWL